jgi:plasmid replication initiation protein
LPCNCSINYKLEEQFTKYELQQVSNLSSAYAVRLYELLIAWRSTGKTPIIELAEFRKKLVFLMMNTQEWGILKTSIRSSYCSN